MVIFTLTGRNTSLRPLLSGVKAVGKESTYGQSSILIVSPPVHPFTVTCTQKVPGPVTVNFGEMLPSCQRYPEAPEVVASRVFRVTPAYWSVGSQVYIDLRVDCEICMHNAVAAFRGCQDVGCIVRPLSARLLLQNTCHRSRWSCQQ